MNTLAETFELLKKAEFEAKLASLQEAWKDDEVRVELLDQALDIIKEAQDNKTLPELDEAQLLDLGVAMVEQSLESEETVEKTAEKTESESEEMSDEDFEKLAEAVGEILTANGLTKEDLESLTEAEEEELGRFCAQELAKQ